MFRIHPSPTLGLISKLGSIFNKFSFHALHTMPMDFLDRVR
jgi:hypothetical protein